MASEVQPSKQATEPDDNDQIDFAAATDQIDRLVIISVLDQENSTTNRLTHAVTYQGNVPKHVITVVHQLEHVTIRDPRVNINKVNAHFFANITRVSRLLAEY